jgi:hypothetical protein
VPGRLDAYRFFTSLPHQSLYNIENDAEAGVTKSKWMTKAIMPEGAGVLEKAKGPTEAAISWIEADINDLAEEQPNVDPRDTCDDDVSEIDPSCLSAWNHLTSLFGCSPRLDQCASPPARATHGPTDVGMSRLQNGFGPEARRCSLAQ